MEGKRYQILWGMCFGDESDNITDSLSRGRTAALNADIKIKGCDGANHGVTSGIVCVLVFCGVVAESMQQIAARPVSERRTLDGAS